MGESQTGEAPVAVGTKRLATIDMFYDADFRQYKWTATERYGVTVVHPDALYTLETYAAY
jgi:hypothetical protein